MLRWVLSVNENTFFCIGSIYLIFCEEEENSSHFAEIPNVVPLLEHLCRCCVNHDLWDLPAIEETDILLPVQYPQSKN